jgi:mono/diheme cytochrome c family protein
VKPMTCNWKIAFIFAALLVNSGVYNIGADDHHTKFVFAVLEQLRNRSIAVRSNSIEAQFVEDPERISVGAQRYSALCVGCHLAPGVTKSDVRQGLYPHPPSLAQEEVQPAQRTFWVIKHGIKMSGMPAWGKTIDDATIWDLVAFVRKLPDMTPETYQQISKGPSG